MRVLCLGNNTELTDTRTRGLAGQHNMLCHGLLSEIEQPLSSQDYNKTGYYHSSVYDIEFSKLYDIARTFDRVVVLDQKKEQYSHPDAFYKTMQLAKKLQSIVDVEFIDPNFLTTINYFEELVNTNPSFCIFPFIELLTSNDYTTVCCRSNRPITKISELKDFNTDKNYQTIRQKMLAGELLPDHCNSCYSVESRGIVSARQQETVEWANRLGLHSIDDLNTVTHPVYYEVRPSNTCNLQCRMCGPNFSHLVDREYLKLKIIDKSVDQVYSNFDIVDLEHVKKLYVAGGEPTAMPEFYSFVDRCIESQLIFEFTVNTNATKISNKFKEQLKQLPHMQFIVSLDGYDQLNHYIRWPSNWTTIVDNVDYLKTHGHVVSFNITVSIYNVLQLHELLSFIDRRYPNTLVHGQFAGSVDDMLSALNHPDRACVLNNLRLIRNLNCYKNDPLLSSFIEGLINHYSNNIEYDNDKLQKFFKFNDLLDQNRNIYLRDYIPELEKYR